MSGSPGRRQAPQTRRDWGWHRHTAEWADRIVRGAGVRPGDLVLDLGAGTGGLTAPLLRTGARVLAVEMDAVRPATLRRPFAGRDVTVVRTDVTALRLPRRRSGWWPTRRTSVPARWFGYCSATTGCSRRTWCCRPAPARRLAADPPGRHAHRYELSLGTAIPRRAFVPAPSVDSVLLRIRRN